MIWGVVACVASLVSQPPLPPVSMGDLAQFPDLETTKKNLQLSMDHIFQLHLYVKTHGNGWGVREWQMEARELGMIWEDLEIAWQGGYHAWERGVEGHEGALRDLRKRIGAQAYYQGHMPPPVPVWRFSRDD